MPETIPGQFAVYEITSGGPGTQLRQTVVSTGPGPNDLTVSEQLTVAGRPIGNIRRVIVPRSGRVWPRPVRSDARTVEYGRERIELAGRQYDCSVLTVESHSNGAVRVEKQWLSPQVPVTHLVRLVVILDGREVCRQELVEFGPP